MKTLIINSFFALLITNAVIAQETTEKSSSILRSQAYTELNFGAALIDGELYGPFPGISFLIGKKTYFNNNTIVDLQIGLAFPSIATAKLGVGYKMRTSELIVGVRPWPMHFYLQTQLNQKPKGEWIMSIEVSPYTFSRDYNEPVYVASMQSYGMLTFGYRGYIGNK